MILPLGAQSREGARKQMNQGNYADAITLLDALEEVYPGQYTSDLKTARKCLSLQKSARSSFNAQRYTEAEDLYRQILKLNPNDRNAQQSITRCQQERDKYWAAEYARCKTVADYKAFAERFPAAPQTKNALEKVKEYDFAQQDSHEWSVATSSGTVSSYTRYISQARSGSKHVADAYRNRARLQYSNAINAQAESYRYTCYKGAREDYDKAKSRGAYLSSEDRSRYTASLAEEKFHDLGSSPWNGTVSSYIDWANNYWRDNFVAPHLHLNTAYSMLVDAYCRMGMFDDARNTVEQYYGRMTSTYFTNNTSAEWTRSEWKTYIRGREKSYKKKQKQIQRSGYSSQSYQARRGSYSSGYSRRPSSPFQLSLPVVIDYTKNVRSIGGGIGVGGYGSPFHADILVMYTAETNYSPSLDGILFKVEPVYNFKKYKSSNAVSDFHVNAGPTIGYSPLYGFTYGAKAGIGMHYTDLAFTASYSKSIGWYIGASFRFHIAHITIRQ